MEEDEELNYLNEEEEEGDEELEDDEEEEDEDDDNAGDESKRLIKKLSAEIALKTSNRAFNNDNMAKKVIHLIVKNMIFSIYIKYVCKCE